MAASLNSGVADASEGGNHLSLGDQKSVGGNAQCCVVVEATPASPLKVAKADLLFELVVVALNAPAQLGNIDELTEANGRRKRRKPIFGRRLLALRPLDQQPFFRPALSEPVIAMCRTDAHAGKT